MIVFDQVGAGILAIPAVTQEAGFLASAVAVILCWIFMVTHILMFWNEMFRHIITIPLFLQVVTGLLIAEVNVNTMCELGSGGVSLVSSFFHIEKKNKFLVVHFWFIGLIQFIFPLR